MEVILNVGCDSKILGKIPPMWVVSAARLQWLNVLEYRVLHSDTETTVVMRVGDFTPARCMDLAKALRQDCIAAYAPAHDAGDLVGPNAAAWGKFNPEFFFMLDGTRLSERPAAKAA